MDLDKAREENILREIKLDDFFDDESNLNFQRMIRFVKESVSEKFKNQNELLTAFLKLTKQSLYVNRQFIDRKSFEIFLQSLGIPTALLKATSQ